MAKNKGANWIDYNNLVWETTNEFMKKKASLLNAQRRKGAFIVTFVTQIYNLKICPTISTISEIDFDNRSTLKLL